MIRTRRTFTALDWPDWGRSSDNTTGESELPRPDWELNVPPRPSLDRHRSLFVIFRELGNIRLIVAVAHEARLEFDVFRLRGSQARGGCVRGEQQLGG